MADSDRPSLEAEKRDQRGSRAARRLRRGGYVPGIVYGGETEPTAFTVGERELRHLLGAGSALFDLKMAGRKTRPVIVKDHQVHPVRGQVVHIDLLEVRLDEKIHAVVPLELAGGEDAPGVKEGGVLEHATRELNIEALPGDIPEQVIVDVSGLEIATTMHLSEVEAPPGVVFLDDPEETIVATISIPSVIEEPDEVEVEPELVGEEAEGGDGAGQGGEPEGESS